MSMASDHAPYGALPRRVPLRWSAELLNCRVLALPARCDNAAQRRQLSASSSVSGKRYQSAG